MTVSVRQSVRGKLQLLLLDTSGAVLESREAFNSVTPEGKFLLASLLGAKSEPLPGLFVQCAVTGGPSLFSADKFLAQKRIRTPLRPEDVVVEVRRTEPDALSGKDQTVVVAPELLLQALASHTAFPGNGTFSVVLKLTGTFEADDTQPDRLDYFDTAGLVIQTNLGITPVELLFNRTFFAAVQRPGDMRLSLSWEIEF